MAGKTTKAFIGIDAGTTGTTVAIYDDKGNEIATGYKEYACNFPRAGWRSPLTRRRMAEDLRL